MKVLLSDVLKHADRQNAIVCTTYIAIIYKLNVNWQALETENGGYKAKK